MSFRFELHLADPRNTPSQPSVGIRIGWHGVTPKGDRLITPMMNTEKEIDCTLDKLIEEINELRKSAKRKLRKMEMNHA